MREDEIKLVVIKRQATHRDCVLPDRASALMYCNLRKIEEAARLVREGMHEIAMAELGARNLLDVRAEMDEFVDELALLLDKYKEKRQARRTDTMKMLSHRGGV